MTPVPVLHGLTGPPGSRLRELLGDGLRPFGPLRPVTGTFERVVFRLSGSDATADELPEATAVRLRRAGVPLAWGAPDEVGTAAELLARCRDRGAASVEAFRADPALLTELQVGAWFDAAWRMRALRRLRAPLATVALRSPPLLTAAADLAFWAGVRAAATPAEWRRLTRASYVALVYHRFAGELKPGQERVDLAPARFRRQLRVLRLAGFRPATPAALQAFHAGAGDLPARTVVVTVDDAMADCVGPLLAATAWRPQLFACTQEVGGTAHWLDGEPVATWPELDALAAAGVALGSHGRRHRRLTALAPDAVEDELAGSLADLRERLPAPLAVVAYPNGDHDETVCRRARAAGYAAGYTTAKGRNGAGTDAHALRRVSVHGHDGAAAVLWKAVTGEAVPGPWLRLRALRG